MTKILIDRSVLEQALNALWAADAEEGTEAYERELEAIKAILVALEQPDIEIPASVPEGWKLVPVEPTDDMLYDIQEYSHILPPRGRRIWAHMLAAAPQPPALEQPQVGQEPVAYFYTASGRIVSTEAAEALMQQMTGEPGKVPLYTHPQPRHPLTEEQILKLAYPLRWDEVDDFEADRAINFAQAIECAHGIGGEA